MLHKRNEMLQESEIIPYFLSPPPGERIIVLAPHPDDETLGCGGTIRLLVEAKKDIKVVFLTSGDKADPAHKLSHQIVAGGFACKGGPDGLSGRSPVAAYSLIREKEAERALKVLGVSDFEFLRFPDRELHGGREDVLLALLKTVGEFMPDTIYTPSMLEVNPDHRAAAALSMEIQRKYLRCSAGSGSQAPVRLVFYEVTTPLRPNVLVDITPVYRRKKRAMKRYGSQLKVRDYLRHITALNTIRALTVSGPRYVEAFWSLERPMSGEEIADWLSYRKTPTPGY